MKRFPYVGLLLIALCSCDPCLEMRSCADLFTFRIVDKVNQRDLVFDPNPAYNRDSVFLMTTLAGYAGPMSSNDGTKFQSRLVIPVDTFYLRLNSFDTDTLLVNYDYVKYKCCKSPRGYGKVIGIRYNGVNARKDGDTYIFEK
jgi:hypothetical protein